MNSPLPLWRPATVSDQGGNPTRLSNTSLPSTPLPEHAERRSLVDGGSGASLPLLNGRWRRPEASGSGDVLAWGMATWQRALVKGPSVSGGDKKGCMELVPHMGYEAFVPRVDVRICGGCHCWGACLHPGTEAGGCQPWPRGRQVARRRGFRLP